ncbi:hypothetical protein KFL_009000010 [Klebsormidium nitens]|uniref:Methyltransferase FkbM domain-containing protein n=1 Tax=Klebsormidium nitens TaxID=105231 RepID=A0A1Y1IMH1_KLENI|nr:hypothetical protein KFL_009000010 [Klebsormidium nitens]|eukprot:GAQ91994.1 hypothetical protein KFL_009000010 [Klebsormidium nitens]
MTVLLSFTALQVIVPTFQDCNAKRQIGIRATDSSGPRCANELSDALAKVADQVDKLEGVVLQFESETQAATKKIGRRSNFEQVINGVAHDVKVLRAERPVSLFLGGRVVMCWVDFFQQYFYLDSRDRGLTPHLCGGTVWEHEITRTVKRIVRSGQRVVDIGACMGWCTAVFAGAVGETGKVLAVEANPRLSDMLARTMQEHPHVRVVNKAVGSQDDTQVFVENKMTYCPGNRVVREANASLEPVEYVKLDTLLLNEGWDRVDVIKIDVDGHEWRVWEGMQETLLENPDLELLLEINFQRDRVNRIDSKLYYEALRSKFENMFIIRREDGLLMQTSPSELLESFGNVNLYLKNK